MASIYELAGYFAVSFMVAFIALHLIFKAIVGDKKTAANKNLWTLIIALFFAFAVTYRTYMGM